MFQDRSQNVLSKLLFMLNVMMPLACPKPTFKIRYTFDALIHTLRCMLMHIYKLKICFCSTFPEMASDTLK